MESNSFQRKVIENLERHRNSISKNLRQNFQQFLNSPAQLIETRMIWQFLIKSTCEKKDWNSMNIPLTRKIKDAEILVKLSR